MVIEIQHIEEAFDPSFKIFHELMAKKIREILLVSSPYDAWIMEEDCRLSERIIREYRGLNLSHPPRLTWASSAAEALAVLEQKTFDMVITMPRLVDMDAFKMGQAINRKVPHMPVILLSQGTFPAMEYCLTENDSAGIDRTFVWSGNTDILLAVIKSTEDMMNAGQDTTSAGIRVIIFVEDSPEYISSLLPIFYRELVRQTQAVISEGLNEEHRLLAMRARPKILVAGTYEEAVELYKAYEPFVLGVISDVRLPRNCKLDGMAGVDLLSRIKKERFDIPLLLTSSEPSNAEKAAGIPARFVDKNSPSLLSEVRSFFLDQLGFGDFVFRSPHGEEIGRASRLRYLEQGLKEIPDDSFLFHCGNNDFSRWLFARSEIELASRVRPISGEDFNDVDSHRQYLISIIHARRMGRQKGVVVNYDPDGFDLDTEFMKIGTGSIGGKARGLAFISSFLQKKRGLRKKFGNVDIFIPQTLVITTDGFDAFIDQNGLKPLSKGTLSDEEIAGKFLSATFPEEILKEIETYLDQISYPLAVRSSSLLEDAQFRAYAGLYKTYMLANDHEDTGCRVDQLINAVKMVYASTYFKDPRAFSKRVGHRTEEEKMAVIIQQVVGEKYGEYLYPAISGVAQSHNYYPFAQMKPEEGIANIALGLGKMVMEGEKTLRFSPGHPQLLPQLSSVDDILENSQRYFYALKMGGPCHILGTDESATLSKRELFDASADACVRYLSGTYLPEEHRIRETAPGPGGFPVLTFSKVLKYNMIPLAEILTEVLAMGREGMGCPVEMEFSVNFKDGDASRPQLAILQVRPMTAREELAKIDILPWEVDKAFCRSENALGNAARTEIADIVYVKPDAFDPKDTRKIALDIGKFNARLLNEGCRYILIGPGRWGSADRWLGIPVSWSDICGVGAIVETDHAALKAEPSQGSHFFHNITTLGINYISVTRTGSDFLKWDWLTSVPPVSETAHVAHIRLPDPVTLKVDGRNSRCVMYV